MESISYDTLAITRGQTPGSPETIQLETEKIKHFIFRDDAEYRAEKDINLSHLKDLMKIFQLYADTNTGCISCDVFSSSFGEVLGGMTETQLSLMFMQIDMDCDALINWDEFSSYLLLRSEGQKLMQEQGDGNLVEEESNLKRHVSTHHKEMIVRIQYIKQLKRYMTCCREGTICYWNDIFKLQRAFINAGQLHSEKKTKNKKGKTSNETIFQGTSYRWIHDALYCDSIQKIAMSSDDHQITIYEGSTLERLLCFDLERVNALTLDFYPGKDGIASMLLYGTDSGHVNVLTFDEQNFLQMAARQKGQIDTIYLERDAPSQKLKQLGSVWRRKAHTDWVLSVRYIPELKLIISVSPGSKDSLSVAQFGNNHKWNFHYCTINKGLNCFAYCSFPQTIATGGTDRIIRLWNPHRLSSPTSTLIGHPAPIIAMSVNRWSGHLLSVCSDKHLKIWDIRSQTCLQTIVHAVKQYPENILGCLFFNNEEEGGSIITSSNTITKYRLKNSIKVQNQIRTHEMPVRKILYNSAFKHLISGCDGSVINVWDTTTGQKTFKFAKAHDSFEITAMTFDQIGRKLITGSRDGTIRVWNYHNGELLQELVQSDKAEVTGIQYIAMKKLSYIIATGWNRKISMFLDGSTDSYTLYPKFVWPTTATLEKFSWHTDDILSMAFLPPSSMATSSYNGDIIILNLNSGKITQQFNPHDTNTLDFPRQKRSIDKLLYLQERNPFKNASLVSCGGDGIVRFWHWPTGVCFFEKNCTNGKNHAIYTMLCNDRNSILYLADVTGWVSLYDITKTGLRNDLESADNVDSIRCIRSFKTHAEDITDMQLIGKMIVTCSTDCTARLFTQKGEFVGIFGQKELWNLDNINLQNTVLPLDILSPSELAKAESSKKLNIEISAGPNSELKRLITGKVSAENSVLETWFSRSLYAKERFINRPHKILSKSHIKLYHELTEIPSLTLPRIV